MHVIKLTVTFDNRQHHQWNNYVRSVRRQATTPRSLPSGVLLGRGKNSDIIAEDDLY